MTKVYEGGSRRIRDSLRKRNEKRALEEDRKKRKKRTTNPLLTMDMLTQEKWSTVNGFNKREIEQYIEEMDDKLIEKRKQHLRKFVYWIFINKDNKVFKYLGYGIGQEYYNYLEACNYSPETIRQTISTLRTFSEWLNQKYKMKVFTINLLNDGAEGKRFDYLITPSLYQRLKASYRENGEVMQLGLMTWLYTQKQWFSPQKFKNPTLKEFNNLQWSEEGEIWYMEDEFNRTEMDDDTYCALCDVISLNCNANSKYVFCNREGNPLSIQGIYGIVFRILSDVAYSYQGGRGRRTEIRKFEDFKIIFLKYQNNINEANIRKTRKALAKACELNAQQEEELTNKRIKIAKEKGKKQINKNTTPRATNPFTNDIKITDEELDTALARKTYRKKITSAELYAQINPENKKLSERFLREKGIRCSDKTIINYESDLKIFFTWNYLYNDDTFFIDIKKFELADFFAYATEELRWGSGRFSRMKSCLSSLSDFVERFFDADYPHFRNIVNKSIESMPKVSRREKTVLTESEIQQVLDCFVDKKQYQKACLFALACYSGARKSELLRFDVDIISENFTILDGLFLETIRPIKTKGRTKEGKVVKKYILKEPFMPYFDKWMEQRLNIMIKTGQEHNSLFIDERNGRPIKSSETIGTWFEELEVILGKPFYMHCLRHYFCTYLSKLGVESDLIVHLFQWASADMIAIYNDQTIEDREWKSLEKIKQAVK